MDARLVRFGEQAARATAAGARSASPAFATEVTIHLPRQKRVLMNGATLAGAEELRWELPVLVFTPDRLAVVKGGPLVRRAYVDRMLGRLFPGQAGVPAEYGRVLAQRNACLRRVRAGLSTREAVVPWTRSLARAATELDAARAGLAAALAAPFARRAEELGLSGAAFAYEERGLAVEDLEARLERDVERGATGLGPHLSDVTIAVAGRDLRSFGSQGEQRLAVLGLVLAEASLLADLRGEPPVLLLDDVLSELDDRRRASLLAALPSFQTLLTATTLRALPTDGPDPALVVEASNGKARPR